MMNYAIGAAVRLCVRLMALTAMFVAIQATAAVGRTPGVFEVSETGAATYRISLWVQPGPNGLQPELALTYNSDNGNGILGVGWSLSGLSSIERCNRTVAQDGGAGGVTLTINDRYCLNGNRLRLETGASYGAANSTYRTEVETFSKVTASGGVAGAGPEYFIVKGKDGRTYEYGVSADSRVVLGPSNIPFRWKLNKVSDPAGNTLLVTYINSNGYAVPATISWTPISHGATSYLYTATFAYSTNRTEKDTQSGYVAGHAVTNNNRLESIAIAHSGQVVRKYVLGYDIGSVTQRSRLTQVQECSNSAASDCLAPTIISYQTGQAGLNVNSLSAVPATTALKTKAYDFNGDNRHDLMYVSSGFWYVAFATTGGFTAPVNTGLASSTLILPERFATNGRDGLLANISGTWWYYYWNDASFTGASTGAPYSASSAVADVDGDGLLDLAWIQGNQAYIRLNVTTAGAAIPAFAASAVLAASGLDIRGQNGFYLDANFSSISRRQDFDGDGRQDLYVISFSVNPRPGAPPTINAYFALPLFSRGTTFEVGTNKRIGALEYDLRVIDFNDDGCSDWVNYATIYIAKCANIDEVTLTTPADEVAVLDWDSDGRDDFLINNGGYLGVYRSTGTNLAPLESTSIPYAAGTYFAIDQDGDGLNDLVHQSSVSPFAVRVFTKTGAIGGPPPILNVPDLAISFTDGFGVSYAPSYQSTALGNHTSGANTSYPLVHISGPRIIVGQVISSDGIGGGYNKTYTYVGARQNAARLEFAGFEQRTETDTRTGLQHRIDYSRYFPLVGMVLQERLLKPDGATSLWSRTNTYETYDYLPGGGAARTFPYLKQSIGSQNDPTDAQPVVTITTTNTFDSVSGTLTDSVTETVEAATANGAEPGASHKAEVHHTLFTDVANHCLGRPQTTTVVRSNNTPSGGAITQQSTTSWNGVLCRATQTVEHAQANSGDFEITIGYGYDDFGNLDVITQTPQSNQGQVARITQVNWGDQGQFPEVVINSKNQQIVTAWNEAQAAKVSFTGVNGAKIEWTPDAFGRIEKEERPDGAYTDFVLTACSSANSYCSTSTSDLRWKVDTKFYRDSVLKRTDVQFFDAFDRTRFMDRELVSGAVSRVVTQYDALGRVWKRSEPGSPGGNFVYTTHSYDVLNRLLRAERQAQEGVADLMRTDYAYDGLQVSVTDPLLKVTRFTHDPLGQVVKIIDALDSHTLYDYDPFGNLIRTTAADDDSDLRNEIILTYSPRGKKRTSNDPDMGLWEYTYYPFGELKTQTDALNEVTTFEYDELSRPTKRYETAGTTTFGYDDSAVYGVGQMTSIATTESGGYSENYTYDTIGRLTRRRINFESVNYDYDYAYDTASGDQTVEYPTVNGERLKVKYEYERELLDQVSQVGGSATVYWGVDTVNVRGQVTDASLGNGIKVRHQFDAVTGLIEGMRAGPTAGSTTRQNNSYLYDDVGNLTQRQQGNPSLTEDFEYDAAHRMYRSKLGGTVNLEVEYNALGNIVKRSDVASTNWTYHASKKHAVTTAGVNTYGYDANGNATTRNSHQIKWTSYNYPYEINGPGKKLTFRYGPERQRYKQVYENGSLTETTWYIGGLLEKVQIGTTTQWRHYISNSDRTVAIVNRQGSTNTIWYLLADHQGSIAMILDSSGTEFVSESFAAFGARRNASTWSGPCPCPDLAKISTVSRRGYTEHEMIGGQSMGLIHMNGRVQDSITGRFLSPDPYVQSPYNAQSLNRYSYVFNNPLTFTDPSGLLCSGGPIQEVGSDGNYYETPSICTYPDFPIDSVYSSTSPNYGGGGGSEGIITDSTEDGNDEDKCTFTDFVRDFGNAIRTSIYNLPNLSIALEFQGAFGLDRNGEYSQYSFSLGVNSLLQGFAQMQGGSNLQGNGDIAVLSSGFNLGYASRAMETGVGQVHTTTGYAYVGPGVSAGIERGAGSAEGSLPTSAAPRSLGRLNAGIGLALGYMHGQATEYTGATDALFGLIDRPGEYSGCGGKF